MLPRCLRYGLLRSRFPAASDFITMGLGIEARHERCGRWWAPHLRLSREFLAAAWPGGGGSLAVLGAGRLLDIPLEAAGGFDRVALFDADPGAVSAWRAASRHGGRSFEERLGDLTGSLEAWTAALRRGVPTSAGLLDLLDMLNPLPAVDLTGFTAIASVNLLSQIPIYWRDRVHSWCADAGIEVDRGSPLEAALERSMGRLQRAHLTALAASGAEVISLLTDGAFLYYTTAQSRWQEDQAIFVPSLNLPGYTIHHADQWFWHIAPQGIEAAEYGSIHDVRARTFRRT